MTRVYGPDSAGEPEGTLKEIYKNGREVSIHTPKMKRCVQHVKDRGGPYNPYAVCTASVGYKNAVLPSHQRKGRTKEAVTFLRENQQKIAKQYGIEVFDYARRGDSVRTVGFSPTKKKWYGWSHRAIAGFGVGDRVKKGDVLAGPFSHALGGLHDGPVFQEGFVAKTLDDAKKMAAAFADAVS